MTPAITAALAQIRQLIVGEVPPENETALLTVLGTVRNEGYADGYADSMATDQSVFDGDDY